MNLFEKKNFCPMLLSELKMPFDSDEYLYEIKFDGHRVLCFVSKDSLVIQTRNLVDVTYLYPELQSIKSLVNKDVIFDGEIVVFDDNVSSFEKIQERSHLKNKNRIEFESNNNPVTFVVFDILYENKDLTKLTLAERKKILDKYKENEFFIKSKCFYKSGISLFKEIKKLGLEGMIAKKISSKYYINKRSGEWIKIKNLHKESFYIYGYIDNKDTVSLLLGEARDKTVYYIGKVSVSKKYEFLNLIKNLEASHNPFVNYDDKYAIYVKPKYKCTVEYLQRTKNNGLRHPVFRKFE